MNRPSPEDFNDLSKLLASQRVCDEATAKKMAAFASKALNADARVNA
jgi:hypothetical protein